MINQDFTDKIQKAAAVVGKTWPLYSFVTSNPLAGYEETSFENALVEAKKLMGISALPEAYLFRQAWEGGKIDAMILNELLNQADLLQQPEFYLKEMEAVNYANTQNPNHDLDRIVSKWIAVFLDEGLSEWEMPGRSAGFYKAWRKLAIHDKELGKPSLDEIPETTEQLLSFQLNKFFEEEQLDILKAHIAALPGWAGYIKYRVEENSAWQQKYPISLADYLAVRLWIANRVYGKITLPQPLTDQDQRITELQHIWLKAWEQTFQIQLANKLKPNSMSDANLSAEDTRKTAQFVFCIDTRSEMLRRHIEKQGNFETFGYAGFFGLATDYKDLSTGLVRKSCPPIVASAYTISETPQTGKMVSLAAYEKKVDFVNFSTFLSKRMKNMLPSAFGYVEGTGLLYGFGLLWRTLFPAKSNSITAKYKSEHESICEPQINLNAEDDGQVSGIPLAQKVGIVKSAFDLLGWKKFAQVVVFAGHASHSANNPFASSLDCGACAASPGRHNARMLAKLANLPEVRAELLQAHGVDIPEDTYFLGAEHDTTTDGILLFDSEAPSSHQALIHSLKLSLTEVQQSTINERLGLTANGLGKSNEKAANWAETRPEWGLAGNAGFVVGPRALTKNIDLQSRCFLHSYDWQADETGSFLEGIMQGPMVVTQWINNHYYFSTVSNEKLGGGSKITHNVTGRFGVVQGNGGDLKIGLPLQSVNFADQKMYHQPLRLSVVIQAPIATVSEILNRNSNLKSLLDNNWIYLMVMDPLSNNQLLKYQRNGSWFPLIEETLLKTAV